MAPLLSRTSFTFDAFIVNSTNEKRELQNQHGFKGEVIAEGCPSFEKSHIERFNTTNNVPRFAQKEKTILLIMVNRHNTFNQYIPVIEIFKKFIQKAIQQEYTLVVKYHPVDMQDDFAQFRTSKYFKETKFPIESLGAFRWFCSYPIQYGNIKNGCFRCSFLLSD